MSKEENFSLAFFFSNLIDLINCLKSTDMDNNGHFLQLLMKWKKESREQNRKNNKLRKFIRQTPKELPRNEVAGKWVLKNSLTFSTVTIRQAGRHIKAIFWPPEGKQGRVEAREGSHTEFCQYVYFYSVPQWHSANIYTFIIHAKHIYNCHLQ